MSLRHRNQEPSERWHAIIYDSPCFVCYFSASTPWYEAYRDSFLHVTYPSDHEFLKHFLACILWKSYRNHWKICSCGIMYLQWHTALKMPQINLLVNTCMSVIIFMMHDGCANDCPKGPEAWPIPLDPLDLGSNCANTILIAGSNKSFIAHSLGLPFKNKRLSPIHGYGIKQLS